eukprot:TRINITY_DN47588_c0_g1_i1.p1 TRINITY_DN47588_c0_g1~~TRINITY_DN47588_c0_g1_i1.p1  ORF type:complete len:248 (-),score=39.23 TRINITY_DN47588_c0_g1_i1:42-785(-)
MLRLTFLALTLGGVMAAPGGLRGRSEESNVSDPDDLNETTFSGDEAVNEPQAAANSSWQMLLLGTSNSRSCCSRCGGRSFCSPVSGHCYDWRARSYYEQCSGSSGHDDSAGSQEGNIKTLYHTTSPYVAKLIVAGNFKPGHTGWCGGAIYFIDHPDLPVSKMNPETTQTGAVVAARVDLGKVCRSTRPDGCDDGSDGRCCPIQGGGHGIEAAKAAGCDSIVFDPSDGDEFIIWDASRVLAKKVYSHH